MVQNVNLNISSVETGDPSSSVIEGTSILLYANGFVNINEVLCKNRGHALRQSGGTIIARIRKITAISAVLNSIVSTISVGQGNGQEKLILYFDEIQALGSGSTISSYDAIVVGEGTGIFIGRRVFDTHASTVEILGANTKGYVKCDEIINENAVAMVLNSFTNQITIDVNYIEVKLDAAVIYCEGTSNFEC